MNQVERRIWYRRPAVWARALGILALACAVWLVGLEVMRWREARTPPLEMILPLAATEATYRPGQSVAFHFRYCARDTPPVDGLLHYSSTQTLRRDDGRQVVLPGQTIASMRAGCHEGELALVLPETLDPGSWALEGTMTPAGSTAWLLYYSSAPFNVAGR